MHKKIDLGRKAEDYEMPTAVSSKSSIDENEEKMIYPSLWISHLEGMKGSDIPESGKAVIEFEKVGTSMRKDEDGEWDGSCEFDVKSITFMGGEKGEKKDDAADTRDAVDKYFDKPEKKENDEEEEEY